MMETNAKHRYGKARMFLVVLRIIGWIYAPLITLYYFMEANSHIGRGGEGAFYFFFSPVLILAPHVITTLGIALLDMANQVLANRYDQQWKENANQTAMDPKPA